MAALDFLNSICEKRSYKSFTNLPHGEYIIRRFSIVESRLGNRVKIDFDDGYAYLPERFNKLLAEHIEELNMTPKIMVYSGLDSSTRRLVDIFFILNIFSSILFFFSFLTQF